MVSIQHYRDELGIPDEYGSRPVLPEYVEAPELVAVGPNIIGRMQQLSPDTARAWSDMQAAATRDGLELLLVSGFRSIADQALLISRKLNAGQTIEDILRINTAPGYSQHHTGRAIDIATPGVRPLTEAFAESAAFTWLQEHAAQYGFTLPYTADNQWGISYEPWHWYLNQGLTDATD